MPAIRDLLNSSLRPLFGEQINVSISQKTQANNYQPLLNYSYHPEHAFQATMKTSALLGQETQEDQWVLSQQMASMPHFMEQTLNEGDVRRLYLRQVSGAVMIAGAFLGVIERSEVGPSAETNMATTVDSRLSFGDVDVMIVELKKPRTISAQVWADGAGAPTNRDKMTKELRMSVS